MKRRKFVTASLLLTGIILVIAYGCTKDDEHQVSKDQSTNVLVYEDESLKEEVSPYFYDNHIYRIELLGVNQEREQIVRAAQENGVDMKTLLIEEAQKFFYNHSKVIMYSIPTLDPQQTVILYQSKGLYQVSMIHCQLAERDRMAYTLKTMDDREYFSVKLDGQNRMGELKIFENEEVKSFNKAVYSLTLEEESLDESKKGAAAICCRKESGWSDCMTCTSKDCAESWLCKVVAVVAPKELIASIAVSCIGAGPDARC